MVAVGRDVGDISIEGRIVEFDDGVVDLVVSIILSFVSFRIFAKLPYSYWNPFSPFSNIQHFLYNST